MSNMSYCRFENTSQDLSDCANVLVDPHANAKLSERETAAAKSLLLTALDMLLEVAASQGVGLDELEEEELHNYVTGWNELERDDDLNDD